MLHAANANNKRVVNDLPLEHQRFKTDWPTTMARCAELGALAKHESRGCVA
jgi:hypothetical protein